MVPCARTRRALPFLLPALATIWLVRPATAQDDGWRTIEIETTEVTTPDVALSPDGEWLIFTMLGKLFRLPVEGGDAEQLTIGLYYDTDLAISPDGNRVAFVSDRDGSEGNVFVLDLGTGALATVLILTSRWTTRPDSSSKDTICSSSGRSKKS